MRIVFPAVLGLSLAWCSSAWSDEITPISVIGTSTFGVGIEIEHLINGTGLSDPNNTPETLLDDVHDFPSDATTMWHSGDNDAGIEGGLDGDGDFFTAPPVAEQILEFDLGNSFDLTAVHIWQMNQGNPGFGELAPDRGVDEFEILVSPADAGDESFSSLGMFNLLVEEGVEEVPAQVIVATSSDVRRVRFALISAHSGLEREFVGLSEVRFEGVPLSSLASDFDKDGDVDGDDFLVWQSNFGTPGGATANEGDTDGDGDVDGDDFLSWQAEFGTAAGQAATAVPEPASGMLVLLILAQSICARHRN